MKHNIVNKLDYQYFFKKKLNWLTDEEKKKEMRVNRDKCLAFSMTNPNENWFAKKLDSEKLKYKRQRIMGFRIFDFFIHELGCAIEIDGPEHIAIYDEYRDIYNYLRSGIVVLRVKNMNEKDATEAIKLVKMLDQWPDRRKRLRIQGKGVHAVDLTNPEDEFWKSS